MSNVCQHDSYYTCNAFKNCRSKTVHGIFQDENVTNFCLAANNPPKGFVFSKNNKRLTIRNVCRDCVDQERPTDLMVIQCNASNVHGYDLAQGYLNVLSKSRVFAYLHVPAKTRCLVVACKVGNCPILLCYWWLCLRF